MLGRSSFYIQVGYIPFRIQALLFLMSLTLVSCGGEEAQSPSKGSVCAPTALGQGTGDTGHAQVFMTDPISSSGNLNLPANATQLDDYRSPVVLSHLTGQGVLKGKYVEVTNGLSCGDRFGAFDPENQFNYSHNSFQFQEAMAYFYGDGYQTGIDQLGYLLLKTPVRIMAHCELDDNAYFVRWKDSGGNNHGLVCLGDSVSTPGASYADDAVVTVHELQHSSTVDNYSPLNELNQFWYDEAGALNEAVSDFMAMIYTHVFVSPSFSLDPKVFSRWALGTFDPSASHVRGAHKCPVYDSDYPNCGHFPSFSVPNASNGNTTSISYVYPDGLGWPYPDNYQGKLAVFKIFNNFPSQEEIHNTGNLLTGALWDMYSALEVNHNGDTSFAVSVSSKLVLEAIRHLPPPNLHDNHSPVTFIGFASKMVDAAALIPELTHEDRLAIEKALSARGLYHFDGIQTTDWVEVGPGSRETPGLFVFDDPERIRSWLMRIGADPRIVTQGLSTGMNSLLDPGEVAAVWFDIQNDADQTAGGVLVTVESLDPEITLLDETVNRGYLSQSQASEAQVMYSKINGKDIVSALRPPGEKNFISTGNTYFKTNPYFRQGLRTAIWVKVSPSAEHGKIVNFSVTASPSNGEASTKKFSVTIN